MPSAKGMSSKGFQFGIEGSPNLFWEVVEHPSWSLERDGPLDKHIPSLLFSRLRDISEKWHLINLACEKITSLMNDITQKFNRKQWKLRVGEEYWELILFINSFFIEARSLLDVLQQVNILLYSKPNELPDSFNDFLKKLQHIAQVTSEKYRLGLESVKESEWLRYLISRDGLNSVRDLQTHYAQIKLRIIPDDQGELVFNLLISRGVNFPVSNHKSLQVVKIVQSILDGIWDLLVDLRGAIQEGEFGNEVKKRSKSNEGRMEPVVVPSPQPSPS